MELWTNDGTAAGAWPFPQELTASDDDLAEAGVLLRVLNPFNPACPQQTSRFSEVIRSFGAERSKC
jgi:hypothetical protein